MSFCLFLLMAASDNYLTIKSFQRARRPVRLCSLLPVVHKHEHAMSAVSFSKPPSTVSSLRSEEHTSELQSLMRISYAVFCLKKKKLKRQRYSTNINKEQRLGPS